MQLRKAIKLAVASAALPTLAFAADPSGIVFGDWTSAGVGGITDGGTMCATTGVSCSSNPINESGFMQRVVNIGGTNYIQTVVTDLATGEGVANIVNNTYSASQGFADESFIAMGGTGGIIDHQNLGETGGTITTPEYFTSQVVLHTGAFEPTNNKIAIDQNVQEAVASDFQSRFQYTEGASTLGGDSVRVWKKITGQAGTAGSFDSSFILEQLNYENTTATTNTNATAAAAYTKLDANSTVYDAGPVMQTFALKERHGAAVSGAGSIQLTTNAVGIDTLQPGGSWVAGDTIVQLAIGSAPAGAGVFGLTDFSNESNSTQSVGFDSQTSAAVPFYSGLFTTGPNSGSDPFAAQSL